jgi:outer membrane protein assembly factor BamB
MRVSVSKTFRHRSIWNLPVIGLWVSFGIPFAFSFGSEWPQFRGPNCSGVAAKAHPPVQISPTNDVLWTASVPWSPSSPCLNGGQVFLTTFADGQLQTRCYSAEKGTSLWTQSIPTEKLELFHNSEGSPSAATPATDGRHVVSYFGSFGLVGYDLKGKELWRHPLPVAISGGSFGSGTSPIIVGSRVILNRDQDQNSSLLALDLKTGKTIWETPRSEAHGSFGTPIIWRNNGEEEIIAPGSVRLKAYDLKNGQERWALDGVPGLACTTPALGDGLLFFAGWSPGKSDSPRPSWQNFLGQYDKNGDGEIALEEVDAPSRDYLRGLDVNHDGKITRADYDLVVANDLKAENVLLAIRPGGRGDISKTHVAWKVTRGLPYVPSPLFYEGRVYIIRDGGMISSFDAKTGKVFYQQERLEATEKYYASPVAADGRIYVISVPGRLTVVKAGGDKPEILHQASFGERVFATPALAGSRLYLRTQTKLYAFGK